MVGICVRHHAVDLDLTTPRIADQLRNPEDLGWNDRAEACHLCGGQPLDLSDRYVAAHGALSRRAQPREALNGITRLHGVVLNHK